MSAEENRLISIGVTPKEATKFLKNKVVLPRILGAIDAAGIPEAGCPKEMGALIIKLCQNEVPGLSELAKLIGAKKITTQEQLVAGIEFATAKAGSFTQEELEAASGVGITVTQDDVAKAVADFIKENLLFIAETGKKKVLGEMVKRVKTFNTNMKFAASKTIVDQVRKQVEAIPDADLEEALKAKNQVNEVEEEETFRGIVASFKSPADNAMDNPEDVQAEHMRITNGDYMTRFPPEPNGWIHIGHAKAMMLDFGLAETKKGKCYMRFDDTNPAKEKDEFIEGIKKDVNWMGFQWYKITHTSDYFQILYDYAIQLIKEGKAYVCHLSKAEASEYRQRLEPSPWRDRPVEESLREFELMKMGYYEPGECSLRLKMDYKNINPNLRDQHAYRIIYKPHPRTHDQWCIYPTYDYSHCVIDSIEHVTHSLCTLEFENRRPSYYWVLDALRIYKPIVWEFSRLNLTHTVMSKRRLQTLVYDGYVNGWDDPRMPTLAGFRRRGYTPSAIRQFCQSVGYTRNVTTIIKVGLLEKIQKDELDQTSPRAFCVTDPLKVTLRNLGEKRSVEAPIFPKRPEEGVRKMTLAPTLYIEREDFAEVPPKGWKRLSLEQPVGLKYANVCIKVAEVVKEGDEIKELICDVIDSQVASYIHWISEGAVQVELRLYGDLFNSADVSKVEDWRTDLNKESLIVRKNALIEPSIQGAKDLDRFQFERQGFFVVDQDSTEGHLVFNRTLPLAARPPELLKE